MKKNKLITNVKCLQYSHAIIFFLCLGLFTACSSKNFPTETQFYKELSDIEVRVTLDKLESVDVDKKENVFLYFNYQVVNNSKEKVFFDPATIKISSNGVVNKAVYYGESWGSGTAAEIVLPSGESSYYLYAVYDDTNIKNGIKTISIEYPGITVEAFAK